MSSQPVYAASQLAEILRTTPMTISRRSRKESWPHLKRRGRGGGKAFPLDSLPTDVRNAIQLHEAKQAAKSTALTCYYHEEKEIPDKARQMGLARLQLHKDWMQHRSKAKSKKKADTAFLAAYNSGQSHPGEFQTLGRISRSSLFRWDRRLQRSDGDWTILCDHRGWGPADNQQGNNRTARHRRCRG